MASPEIHLNHVTGGFILVYVCVDKRTHRQHLVVWASVSKQLPGMFGYCSRIKSLLSSFGLVVPARVVGAQLLVVGEGFNFVDDGN